LGVASEDIPRALRKGEVKDVLRKIEQGNGSQSCQEKSKKIEKQGKESKKRGRPRKRQSEVREDELLKPE
jgi:hypothetical protein